MTALQHTTEPSLSALGIRADACPSGYERETVLPRHVLGRLRSKLVLTKDDLPTHVVQAIRDRLTFINPDWSENEKHGRSNYRTGHYLYSFREGERQIGVPPGAVEMTATILSRYGLTLELDDCRVVAPPIDFPTYPELSSTQLAAADAVIEEGSGALVMPAGAGKTEAALWVIAQRRQPTLWLTHSRELADQVADRARLRLGLTGDQLGAVGGGKHSIGSHLTIATVQTLDRRGIPDALLEGIGFTVVDEMHHCPALMFARVLWQLPCRYRLGLTATPYRRDGLNELLQLYIGPIVARVAAEELTERLITPKVLRIDTGVRVYENSFTALVSRLVERNDRNDAIVRDVQSLVDRGRKVLIITDRVQHAAELARKLNDAFTPAAELHGAVPKAARESIRQRVVDGQVSVVCATGALIGEGWDCPQLDTLLLATPLSYRGRLIQYVGRVCRTAEGKSNAWVIDYADDHPMLWSSWRQRRETYEHQGYQVHISSAA